jgi:hypothetical protein
VYRFFLVCLLFTVTDIAAVAAPVAAIGPTAFNVGSYPYPIWPAVTAATHFHVLQRFGIKPATATTAPGYDNFSHTLGNTYSYDLQACSSGCLAYAATNPVTITSTVPSVLSGVAAELSDTYLYGGPDLRTSAVATDDVSRVAPASQKAQLQFTQPTDGRGGTDYMYLHEHQIAQVKP